MNIVVCGGLGFIGSEVCRQLLKGEKAGRITIIDDDSKGYNTNNIEDICEDWHLSVIKLDLTIPDKTFGDYLRYYIDSADYVLNFASKIGGIGYFNKIPADIIRDNSLINTTIMDLCVSSPKKPVYLYVSSSMVFESATYFPSHEDDVKTILPPITAYGQSKLVGEWYCEAYRKQHGLKYVIVRPFNALGPERPDKDFVGYSHVIPDLICKIYHGQGTEENPLEILGDGNQVRHYTDVREIADGILTCLFNERSIGESFNIAIKHGHTVTQIAHIIYDKMRPNQKLHIKNVPGFPHDVKNRQPDTTKMREWFGWEAKNTIEDLAEDLITEIKRWLK